MANKLIHLVLVLCLVFMSCTATKKKVIYIGSGISTGVNTANLATESCPAQLATLLRKDYVVENYGVSGSSMLRADNHSYWNTDEYQKALAGNPDIVFIDLGGNDNKLINQSQLDKFEKDCRAMIRSFATLPSNPRIILLTPTLFFNNDSTGVYNETILHKINPLIWTAAGCEGVEVIEMYPDVTSAGKIAYEMYQYLMANPTYSNVVLPPNPFITHMYTADPSAHVWEDGRLYVYPSHDISPARGCDLMDRYHIFSTDDMVNWKDHGEIFSSADVPWGRPEGGFMWAPDCAYKDGTYYYYFPHPSESYTNNSWKVGIATSSKPAEDFTVLPDYVKGLESLIDPCVFRDDDGQYYFYQGGGSVCKGAKLKDNMMEIEGELQLMEGLEDFHEGAWVFKRNGVYYLTYADNHTDGNKYNRMRYAVSDNPLGPWKYAGIYLDATNCYTIHGSVVEYKGQWYAFYHNNDLSGGNHGERSICVDKLYFNLDGTIRKVFQTKSRK